MSSTVVRSGIAGKSDEDSFFIYLFSVWATHMIKFMMKLDRNSDR